MNTLKASILSLSAALGASLCCIAPLLSVVAGTTSLASSFQWIEPYRPFLIALTVITLAVAWISYYRRKSKEDCDCEAAPKWYESARLLSLVTVASISALLIPQFLQASSQSSVDTVINDDQSTVFTIDLNVEGMTCQGCATTIQMSLNKLQGIQAAHVSYQNNTASITLDSAELSVADVRRDITQLGYKVKN